jgi:hypothetical protein
MVVNRDPIKRNRTYDEVVVAPFSEEWTFRRPIVKMRSC